MIGLGIVPNLRKYALILKLTVLCWLYYNENYVMLGGPPVGIDMNLVAKKVNSVLKSYSASFSFFSLFIFFFLSGVYTVRV